MRIRTALAALALAAAGLVGAAGTATADDNRFDLGDSTGNHVHVSNSWSSGWGDTSMSGGEFTIESESVEYTIESESGE